MKRVFILIAGLISIVLLSSCSNSENQNFYGTYTFEKVSYLSVLSSSTIDYLNERMVGTKYTIEADLFRIDALDYSTEINSPKYVEEEIQKDLPTLFDTHALDGNKIEHQYTIYKKDGSKENWRLYVSANLLWIATYVGNTSNDSENIMYIYKLSKPTSEQGQVLEPKTKNDNNKVPEVELKIEENQMSQPKETSAKNQMPESMPKNFEFIFKYGINGKNQLDTLKGKYIQDMVVEASVRAELKLSEEEMNTIYLAMKQINILEYPKIFKPKSNVVLTPFQTFYLKITFNHTEKVIKWSDQNLSNTNEAVKLRDVFTKIEKIIIDRDEVKKLPKPKGGYQ